MPPAAPPLVTDSRDPKDQWQCTLSVLQVTGSLLRQTPLHFTKETYDYALNRSDEGVETVLARWESGQQGQ